MSANLASVPTRWMRAIILAVATSLIAAVPNAHSQACGGRWVSIPEQGQQGVNGKVFALTTLPSGDLVAGGSFTMAGGVAARNIARWNGTSWSALGSGVSGDVFALTTLPSGDLVAGGDFSAAGTVGVRYIARWNGSSWSPLSLGMEGLFPQVLSLTTLPSGELIAGGNFSSAFNVNGTSRIARWNGTSWSALGVGLSAPIHALTTLPNGDVFAGGRLNANEGIARWNGTSWSLIGPGVSGSTVLALTTLVSGDTVAGGSFTTIGGVAASGIARWNGTSWSALGTGVDGTVNALLTLPSGDLVAAGNFGRAGGVAANRVARWNGTSWSALGTNTGVNAVLRAVTTLSGGVLVVGGDFTTAGGVPANGVARLSSTLRRIDPLDASNEPTHKTNLYALNQPPENPEQRTILRRGSKPSPGAGTADFDVVVADCFDPQQHVLSFEAEHTFDGAPVVKTIPFYTQQVPAGQWGCVLREPLTPPANGERIAKMRVFIPADGPEAAAVGEYTFKAVVKTPAGTRLEDRAFAQPVVLLFNPWDPADAAYVASEFDRAEYVMATAGLMWKGTVRSNDALGWNYAQFADATFLATLELLGGLNSADRADPAKVSRWLTDQLDANGGGVLEGNWSGNYSGGLSPLDWRSSDQVFALYRANPARVPVKYGQCWVYAGLLTSALRTLGVPARPVTNFGSAVDLNGDGVVSECWYYDLSTFFMWNVRSEDRLWNFHVWCEAWMGRPGYAGVNGWQALDATPPQPTGLPFWRLGPAPVAAVRQRLASIPFDVPFMVAAVDADIVHQQELGGQCVEYSRDATYIGRRITTKGIGTVGGVDITSTYKTPETTPDPDQASDVTLSTPASVPMGIPIEITVEIRNTDTVPRDVSCYAMFHALNDRGERLADIGAPTSPVVTIPAGGTRTLTFAAAWPLVQPVLGSSDVVQAFVVVTRTHDERRWFEQARVRVLGLPMQIAIAPAVVVVGGDAQATISYANPLGAPLPGARLLLSGDSGLRIVGPGGALVVDEEIELGTLQPGAAGTLTRTLRASGEGRSGLVGRFVGQGTVPGNAGGTTLVIGTCYANCDASSTPPVLNALDFQCFLDRFRSEDPYANCDGSTVAPVLNALDFQCFLNRFRLGCQ